MSIIVIINTPAHMQGVITRDDDITGGRFIDHDSSVWIRNGDNWACAEDRLGDGARIGEMQDQMWGWFYTSGMVYAEHLLLSSLDPSATEEGNEGLEVVARPHQFASIGDARVAMVYLHLKDGNVTLVYV